jgi:hypothetical protein
MTLSISFNDGNKDITVTTTKALEDICSALNNERYINFENAIIPSIKVEYVKVVTP